MITSLLIITIRNIHLKHFTVLISGPHPPHTQGSNKVCELNAGSNSTMWQFFSQMWTDLLLRKQWDISHILPSELSKALLTSVSHCA